MDRFPFPRLLIEKSGGRTGQGDTSFPFTTIRVLDTLRLEPLRFNGTKMCLRDEYTIEFSSLQTK